jgi:hypothetical protein
MLKRMRFSLTSVYFNPVKKVGKEVRYWVGVVRHPDAAAQVVEVQQEKEVNGARWCTWEEARELITFQGGRDVLEMVGEVLGE